MSNSFSPADELRSYRPLLLACEAIGWLHMAGKAHPDFLAGHGGINKGYDYKKWHEEKNLPWDELTGWIKHPYPQLPSSAWPNSFTDFIEKHTSSHNGLLGLLQAGHGMASGIEKNLPNKTSKYLGQSLPHMWLFSPFGYPRRNLLVNPPETLTDTGWQRLVEEIRRLLDRLNELGKKEEKNPQEWQIWRNQAVGHNSFLRNAFLATLAETRLPNNDVTLWDQSYVAAALFKSAVAGALLAPNFPWDDNYIKKNIRWRLLTVALGSEHYEARAVKIGDWSGMQDTLAEFYRRVCDLIEVDLAVGALLYYDSSTLIFSFPGERFNESVPAQWLSGWKEWLQGEVDAIAQYLNLETPSYVHLSAPTRSLVKMARERHEAQKIVAAPVHRPWQISEQTETKGHVCPVCRVRLNGDPSDKGKPCSVCLERRTHRLRDWLSEKRDSDTIWFEEVADTNNRLALLTLTLDLEPWLNGERVDSLRAQSIPDWKRFNPEVIPEDAPGNFVSLWEYIKSKLNQFDKKDPILLNLQDGFGYEENWKSFYQKIVEDRAEAPDWNNLSDAERAEWLTHQLFCKLPSPGRVYRFWRETEMFFQNLLVNFREHADRDENRWRIRRVVLIPKPGQNQQFKDGTLYDGYWQGKSISLIFIQGLNGFLTVSNLARLLNPEDKPQRLANEIIELLEEESGTKYTIQIQKVEEVKQKYGHLGEYHPLIPLEVTPLRFRVILPLEAVSACIDLAIRRWQEEFSRVWDRLPLHIGVVAFPRTLPFQAVIETVRNLEEDLGDKIERWELVKKSDQNGTIELELKRADGRLTQRMVPYRLPDGREDVFYPYFAVGDKEPRCPRDFRHPMGQVYRHVADLQVGDKITVATACISTVWMDSSAVRFEPLAVQYLEDWINMRECWTTLKRVAPSRSALQALRSELARLEKDWRESPVQSSEPLWKDMVRAMLVNHLELNKNDLGELLQAELDGTLKWALDWHIATIKESLKKE